MKGHPGIGREALVRLLGEAGAAEVACRAALDNGAEFVVYDEPIPAAGLAQRYARRLKHLESTGKATLGVTAAIEALTSYGEEPVLLGSVSGTDPAYHFQLFVSASGDRMVACLGVAQP